MRGQLGREKRAFMSSWMNCLLYAGSTDVLSGAGKGTVCVATAMYAAMLS